ncbi:hypothetical protein BDY19DRAFT_993827 [Irpex rosettiformis]|uniref:Uncharacterized protein n=1 Tax=Irpex rosettiformis TaxID=378272 RepID=A0ACB8U3R6_9APHY|nr:hypothetical protein BDY19DRAFT_993827 [Irpex rosettiformis]
MAKAPLTPQAKRLQTIMVTVPIIGAVSYVLYERLVQGKPRRMLPSRDDTEHLHDKLVPIKPEDFDSKPSSGSDSHQ